MKTDPFWTHPPAALDKRSKRPVRSGAVLAHRGEHAAKVTLENQRSGMIFFWEIYGILMGF